MSRKLLLILILLCVVCIASLRFYSGRRNSIAFCSGEQCKLTRLEIRGQGVKASLTDRDSLQYLLTRPRLKDEPVNDDATNGYSFDGWVYGGYSMNGRIDIFISQPVSFLRLIYFDSHFEDFDQRYLIIEKDAPSALLQCLKYLVSSNEMALRQ